MSDLLPPPYPADTRAKGWRFELDYEQIDQSDTWPIAAEIPMAQHALLMMWFVAWVQVPCGSFPNDEAVVRAKCRIPASTWAKCRDVLMRGWWAASDGRLYHETLTKRVFEMMARRRSDSDRQAAKRARLSADSGVSHTDVTRDKPVTPPEVTRESSTDNRQPIKRISKPSASHPPAGGFDDFWLAWPKSERKQDKAKCLAHWKLKNLAVVADQIIADVRVKRGTTKWQEGFVEAPLVYLHGKRWEDGVTPDDGRPGEGVVDWRDAGAPTIIAKGVELGVGPWDQMKEQWYPYRDRVFAAADAAELVDA
jgi:hypothetical protein